MNARVIGWMIFHSPNEELTVKKPCNKLICNLKNKSNFLNLLFNKKKKSLAT